MTSIYAAFNPADIEADGADARALGYGLDRNPYSWSPDRGPELDGHYARRMAWERGWTLSLPLGSEGPVTTAGAEGVRVVTIGEPRRFCGKAADDHTPWTGVAVRFVPLGGTGVIDVAAVAWGR